MSTPPAPTDTPAAGVPSLPAGGRRALPPGPGFVKATSLLTGFLDHPIETLDELHRGWGDIVMLRSGGFRIVAVFDPELISKVMVASASEFAKGRTWRVIKPLLGEGLFTSEGELHKRQRRLVAPAFQPRNLAPYAQVMVDHTRAMVVQWRDGERLDIHHAMVELSLSIAGLTMFGAELDGEEGARFGRSSDEAISYYRYAVMPGSSLLFHTPVPWVRKFKRARKHIDDTVYSIIRDRRDGSDAGRGDLLTLMLAARDTEGDGDGAGMSDQQLRDEAVTMLVAGHETVASSMAWTFLLLSRHPEIVEAMRAELDEVAPDGRALTADDLSELSLLRRVCMESLRLYPPGYATVREAVVDTEIGGYRIPKGTEVSVPIMLVHRDERWWPDPERFDPDRFLEGADADRPKHAYIPFGTGRRVCIGQGFALMEMALVLGTILREYMPHVTDPDSVKIEALFTMRPKGGLYVELERAADAATESAAGETP